MLKRSPIKLKPVKQTKADTMKILVILTIAAIALAGCKEEDIYPTPINSHTFKGPQNITIGEFDTSSGHHCVAVAGAGLSCDW